MSGSHVRLSDKAHDVLNQMHNELGVPRSKVVSEVVCAFREISQDGSEIFVKRPNGEMVRVVFPSLGV